MKNSLFPILLLVLLTSLACNNDDDTPGTTVGDGCNMSYTVEGENFEENDIVVCLFLDNTLNLGLIGSNNIQLQINNLNSPGTYDISEDVIVLVDLDEGATRWGAESGSVTVNEINENKARGTFSFILRDITDGITGPTRSLTNGSFNSNF